jgi:hypothetical protein
MRPQNQAISRGEYFMQLSFGMDSLPIGIGTIVQPVDSGPETRRRQFESLIYMSTC